MNLKPTQTSLDIVREIATSVSTFHHHYHILYDIANTYPVDYVLNYVEIGCYAGGSACLMIQRPNTNVISIDLGTPIDTTIVKNNVNKVNKHDNFYNYLEGNSHNLIILTKLTEIISEIDILFIDGDHSFNGVLYDFETYSKMVKRGGYIIFDDYNDHKFSPQVKPAVDMIIPKLSDTYKIIGTFENSLGARPVELLDGNCYIIQKL
jgi:cephalosporin hydroxylase